MIDILDKLYKSSGLFSFLGADGWKYIIMIIIAIVLLYLAIFKEFEPYLLIPIGFAMLLVNIPGTNLFVKETVIDNGVEVTKYSGLFGYLYYGVSYGIYPSLIFLGIGATTDFGPLLARPKSMLLGAAAQIGIFITFLGAILFKFTGPEAAAIGIIGGADGPTAILLSSQLAPHLLGAISIAAYSYMALVPVIQPPIIRLLTSKKERVIEMTQLREVSKKEKIIFPIIVSVITITLIPSSAPLIGMLMLGNLIKESGVVPNLITASGKTLLYIVTILLGITIGATTKATNFLQAETLMIIGLGLFAFIIATICGILGAKLMNVMSKEKINPIIGAAGVSAVPMAARVAMKEGKIANANNYLLMHAMGPNVAGVIGSAIAAGLLLSYFG
ncbi:MAG: sodium ion-translocating decarboxylase subunit beta [Tenericutes bacterium]|jgi:sodium ion-translocating decarboxylase beta subunit|nr:sodium ion-translocating decarboxylase subunit beta [Mycoplasmatota bacterium]